MLGIELNLRRGAASRAVDRRRRGKALDGVPSGADDGLGRVLPVLVRAPAHLHEEHRVEAVAARHLDAAEVVAPRRPATAVGRDGIPRQRVRSGAAVLLVLRLVLESKAPRILARLFEAPRRPSQRRRLPSPPPRARDRRHHQRGAAERQRRREQHVAQRGHHERCSLGCALRQSLLARRRRHWHLHWHRRQVAAPPTVTAAVPARGHPGRRRAVEPWGLLKPPRRRARRGRSSIAGGHAVVFV